MNHHGQAEWRPQEEVLQSVLEVLQDSFIPDSVIQKDVQTKLCALNTHPDLLNYFMLILENIEMNFDDKTRALAGVLLKNNLTYLFESTPAEIVENLKIRCLKLLTDNVREVRSSVSAIINVVALKGGIENWPELLPYLMTLLECTTGDITDSTIKTLMNICEDYLSQRYHISQNIEDCIKKLLLKFVDLTAHESSSIRIHSFRILNEALQKFYPIIHLDFDSNAYLQRLIGAANEPNEEIIILVCQGFTVYINNKDETILPLLNDIIKYMLAKTSDKNEEISLQATEFWYSISKLPSCREMMSGCLAQLVPMLVHNMKYSEYEINVLKSTLGSDNEIQDRSEDIKPFAKSMGDDDDPEIGWTLRKCSAATLDGLAVQFKHDFIPFVMPLILKNLDSSELLEKECGILALGAIADGCFDGLINDLPNIIPPLIECMDHPHSLIRAITCWTISRYVRFTVEVFFVPVMMTLLKHSLDDNKRVQRAAISSFCFFQEEAKLKLIPYLDVIGQAFMEGFKVYKMRSLYLLYDAIAVLAQVIGSEFKSVFQMLMVPLLNKFNTLDDYNNAEEFLAICECLGAIVSAVDVEFLPYTEIIFHKCCVVVSETVQSAGNYEYEDFDKDLVSGALDLLVAMACNLKTYFVKFVVNSNIMDQLFYVIQDESIQVRQPGLALLGEIIRLCYDYISNQVHLYIPPIIENLDKRFNGACNNAAWTLGRLCIVMEAAIAPYSPQIVEHLLEVLQSTDGMQIMYKSTAITLCILGLVCPQDVSPCLKSNMRLICSTIRNVADCEDKELAFRGLCDMVMHNPDVLVNDLIYFCDAVASWNEIKFDLKEKIRAMLLNFRQLVGEEDWNKVYGHFPMLLKNRMAYLYGV